MECIRKRVDMCVSYKFAFQFSETLAKHFHSFSSECSHVKTVNTIRTNTNRIHSDIVALSGLSWLCNMEDECMNDGGG